MENTVGKHTKLWAFLDTFAAGLVLPACFLNWNNLPWFVFFAFLFVGDLFGAYMNFEELK